METNNKHVQDLTLIREMMERSSRFLSLSGWSGISAGIFALAGAYAAYQIRITDSITTKDAWLVADALIVLILALSSTLFFSSREARKKGTKLWSPITKKLIAHMALPLLTGGALSAIMLSRGMYDPIAGITLIFYGFALVSAGRFTNREAVILGISEIVLGLIACILTNQSLWIWATGFGLLHILYGIILYLRYERSSKKSD